MASDAAGHVCWKTRVARFNKWLRYVQSGVTSMSASLPSHSQPSLHISYQDSLLRLHTVSLPSILCQLGTATNGHVSIGKAVEASVRRSSLLTEAYYVPELQALSRCGRQQWQKSSAVPVWISISCRFWQVPETTVLHDVSS